MTEPEPPALAVYGTLRRGQRNHRLLDGCAFLGSGHVRGALFDVPRTPFRAYAYPALVEDPNGLTRVELYAISLAMLPILDELERYDPLNEADSQYVRRVVEVLDGPMDRGHVYVYRGDPGELGERIESGDWVTFSAGRA
jgi:gamma-glutamylcyclotransferase (GGCT)/AIG2-like uncharacterized protein YtfP